MWLRIAATCNSRTRVETLTSESPTDWLPWLRDQVDDLCSDGARGRLYIFLRTPPDDRLAAALRWVVADRRLEPAIVAAATALTSGAHLELLRRGGVGVLYLTLQAAAPAPTAGAMESPGWRRTLGFLSIAPRLASQLRVGAHFLLSREAVGALPGLLPLLGRIRGSELLLWDAGSGNMDAAALEPAAALRALDAAISLAPKYHVSIRAVGFERTRSVVPTAGNHPCVASGAVIELLRAGIPLPSAYNGLLATDGDADGIAAVARTGTVLSQVAFELAATGRPLLDLPACLGGPPPQLACTSASGVKVDGCRQCPIDSTCAGAPASLMAIPGLSSQIRPLRHWQPLPARSRALVLCPVVHDELYGATFFSLARALAGLGAQVDLVSPWGIHRAIAPSFAERQPIDRPASASEVEKFAAGGPVEPYDLIVTPSPDLRPALALLRNPRLRSDTRLAATDSHMLQGMDEWVRDLCPPGQQPSDANWWPSEQVVLHSAFPGYAPLYARYGIPMRQVAWQPYALDPGSFRAERPVTEGTSLISAGRHRRDLDTLFAAATRLGDAVHPIDLFAEGQGFHVPRQVRFHGTVSFAVFCPAVGRSRFMIVPLLEDPHSPAGITAMVTAIMCGRPIIATATAAARDYVVDGVTGLLVPSGDPRALAEAIERLDTDPALLATLASGAANLARKLTTEAWASALLFGSRTYERDHWMWMKWRRPA